MAAIRRPLICVCVCLCVSMCVSVCVSVSVSVCVYDVLITFTLTLKASSNNEDKF